MRSQIVAGYPRRHTHGTALVNGYPRGIGVPGSSEANPNWVAQLVHIARGLVPWVMNLLHMGPGYTAANGGEVYRQLETFPWLQTPRGNAFVDWIKKYNPHNVWNTGKIWDFSDTHPSNWLAIYDQYLAAGMPAGTLLDANMKPVGLDEAYAAATQPTPQGITAAQLQMLEILAMQVAGLDGAANQAAAQATVATLPKPWQDYVVSLAAIWTANAANDGKPAGKSETGLLAAAAALLLFS